MRIAQVAPLAESCPPCLYGGTERVASFLTEELVARGHEVVLFASGDSVTGARLVAAVPTALRLAGGGLDPYAYAMVQLAQVARAARRFDVLHFHWDYLHFPLADSAGWPPVVTTLHGRLDLPHFADLTATFPAMHLVSISDSQRRPIPDANWAATVYHGLPLDLFPPGPGDGGYLVFLGRLSREKRVDRAVEIARRVGMPLRIAAKVDPADRDYFEREVKPLFDEPFVTYLGEADDDRKRELLGGAAALLFPIDWPEPFGLVMIESMACGTPVVAYAHGSVPEVIEEGRTGFAVRDLDEAVDATRRALTLDRAAVRAGFEARFSVERMVDAYVEVYEDLVAARKESARRAVPADGLRPVAAVK